MSFIEATFPSAYSLGARLSPEFNTTILESTLGYEVRSQKSAVPRRVYEIQMNNRTQAQKKELRNFFLAVAGAFHSFRFKDWSDYQSDEVQSIGTGNGVQTQFQLKKTYSVSAPLVAHERTITKPVNGTVKVYKNGVLQTETTDYTVNYATGIVTFVSAPASTLPITAEFEFDVPVRMNDVLSTVINNPNLFDFDELSLIEVFGE